MHKIKSYILIFFISVSTSHWAEANKCLMFAPAQANVTYDPTIDEEKIFSGLNFTVSRKFKNKRCKYQVFLAEEGSEDQENQPYSYYKSSAGQNLFTSTSGFSGLIKTRRKGGVEQNIDYFVKLNLGWVAAGIYMDSYDLLLYEVKKKPKNLTVRSTSTLNVTVPSVGLLSLVDKDAPFDFSSTTKALDFGELMPNESQSFDVVVKTNSQNYSVYFTSENRGRLKGQQHPSVMIPYTLKVNGRSISLRSASSRVAQGGMALFGERYTNTIVIAPNLSGKTAQTYSDTITVTLSVD